MLAAVALSSGYPTHASEQDQRNNEEGQQLPITIIHPATLPFRECIDTKRGVVVHNTRCIVGRCPSCQTSRSITLVEESRRRRIIVISCATIATSADKPCTAIFGFLSTNDNREWRRGSEVRKARATHRTISQGGSKVSKTTWHLSHHPIHCGLCWLVYELAGCSNDFLSH